MAVQLHMNNICMNSIGSLGEAKQQEIHERRVSAKTVTSEKGKWNVGR